MDEISFSASIFTEKFIGCTKEFHYGEIMRQKEFERWKKQRNYAYPVQNKTNLKEEHRDGYFSFFKLRCLICFVLFLFFVAVDRRIDVQKTPLVRQVMQYLNEETIPVQSMFPSVKNKN